MGLLHGKLMLSQKKYLNLLFEESRKTLRRDSVDDKKSEPEGRSHPVRARELYRLLSICKQEQLAIIAHLESDPLCVAFPLGSKRGFGNSRADFLWTGDPASTGKRVIDFRTHVLRGGSADQIIVTTA